ncbi:hypothetical protein PXJ20_23205 [Paraburkholderia sp. A1RI_3L]|uniref:hypothetical protein n=1 Tax=Paraburkholderia TaxID=1822464 RepID=UPI003B8088D5
MALMKKGLRVGAARCRLRYLQRNRQQKFATTAWHAGSSNSGRFAAQFDAWREAGNFAGRFLPLVPSIPDPLLRRVYARPVAVPMRVTPAGPGLPLSRKALLQAAV